jgi:transcriptional regulator with XRE-family HTH domain
MRSNVENILTPEQSKAARALLAWSQQELASAARVAISTVADYERGARTPVANNAQAIREALEGQGLQFIAGGVVEKDKTPPPPAEPRQGALRRWVNAQDLSQWGKRRDAQGAMPELLSRLIYATHGPVTLRFPSEESVQYPGWDGVCVVSSGSQYVPEGESVWEMGVQQTKIRQKADGDFKKRSANPLGRNPKQTTFVFVTLHRFAGKDKWVTEKRALGIWRDVVAFDGDDLTHWLENCPAVAQWLAVRAGTRPEGLRNLEEFWAEWVRATQTPLTPDIVLTGRDKEQAAVLKWLRGQPSLFPICAEAPDEAVAFLYAAISVLPRPYRLSYLSRCVLADTPDTARQLIGLRTPLIVILMDPEAGLARRLADDGHHVIAGYGADAQDFLGTPRLSRPWTFDLQLALRHMGLKEEEAYQLARASGRSITVLRRLMPATPNYAPLWAKPASPALIAALFAGSWVETSPEDRQIMSRLADCPYSQVEETLARLATAVDGPLIRSGTIWKAVSLRDLWMQIGGQITMSQYERFETVFRTVLGATDSHYTACSKGRYEPASKSSKGPSGMLRHGLTEALIALAVYPDQARHLAPDLAGRVNRTISGLLNKAPPELWWSLAQDFCNIAEAAPNAFLEALDAGLEGDSPPVMALFRSDAGLMYPQEYLSNLLWALEMLARSPDYLMRSALLLARLSEIDPGGAQANRPFRSLRQIFWIWGPQTYADTAQRLKVVDRIVRQYPAVGWKLLLALAPRPYDTSDLSAQPAWRDFAPDELEPITPHSVGEVAAAIGKRLLDQVGDSAERWQALLDLWGHFDRKWRIAAVKQLEDFGRRLNDAAEIEAMRDKLRGLLHNHRGFRGAPWAMGEKDLKPLDKVFDILQPRGIEDQVRWLFLSGANRLRPNIDWRTEQAETRNQQTAAAEALLAASSPDQLFAFASTITWHHALGAAIARTSVKIDVKHDFMKRGLLADKSADVDVGLGILYELKSQAGENSEAWVRELWHQAIKDAWGEQAELHIVHCLSPEATTWADIEARSAGLADTYWRTLDIFSVPNTADLDYVVEHLLAVGRSRDVLGWLSQNIKRNPEGKLVVRVLHEAAQSDLSQNGNDTVMLGHFVGILLNYLETDPEVSEQQIVGLEWIYFQALRHSQRPPRTLHRALAQDPKFFVHLLKLLFLPAEDSGIIDPEPENLESIRELAHQAYDVLHSWTHVPGADDQGVIDSAALENWVKVARKLLAESGRSEIGDSQIGKILASAKGNFNEHWPPEPVCDVIEITRSRALEEGFEVGVYNQRGVTVRALHDGGEQERALAEHYRRHAEALRFDWPRISACLDRIATTYQADATQEDRDAERRDWR